ncbi:MAG: hypothetical protein HY545_01085 [Candidatus Doudnabacteria bacterium]|nr:hypothetical protein [Candidatus Doudnabacteria bacterium]
MNRIAALLALLVLMASPSVAQDKFDRFADLEVIAKNLTVPPLQNDFCTLFQRYAAARVLENDTIENPQLLEKLRITSKDVVNNINHTVNWLETALVNLLYVFLQPAQCEYRERVGVSDYRLHVLYFRDVYELVQSIRELYRNHPLLQEVNGPIAAPSLTNAVVEYATEQGPRLREVWLKYQKLPETERWSSDEYRKAEYLLWSFLTQEGIAPSVMRFTMEETYRFLESKGHKPGRGTN